MPSRRTIHLKVDVDTFHGMREGVPRLLELLREEGVKATFFLSFGPDRSGKALFNIWRQKGFLKKMLRTNAAATYGLRTLFYGTLLPAPKIAKRFPDLVRRIDQEGHEVGIHAWDHRLWQDHLDELDEAAIREEYGRARRAFEEILGRPPRAAAAPAWYVNLRSLTVEDTLHLDYASDTRGRGPFRPVMEGRTFATPQLPTNTVCLEEVIGREARTHAELLARLRASIAAAQSPPVFPVHAEVEGGRFLDLFRELLRAERKEGSDFHTLEAYRAILDPNTLPPCPVRLEPFPGRGGVVAVQG